MMQVVGEWADVCVVNIQQTRQRVPVGRQCVECLLGQVGMTTDHVHKRLKLIFSSSADAHSAD